MITSALIEIVRCPDCGARLIAADGQGARCTGCGRLFDGTRGYLDLRPAATFAEQTKYLDEALHSDARHETIAPPVLGSKVRNDMLRAFLAPAAGDRVLDLGCGSGRAMAWNSTSGASIVGLDISPYFAPEAVARFPLVLGDLRRLPVADASFTKAWSLDVLEHLSPQALAEMLAEANRVLTDDGRLFVYTHVRKNGWPAAGVRAVNRFARWCERLGLLDLSQERLRKSDHLNPLTDHDDLTRRVTDAGFAIERITYYTPVAGAFVENVLTRIAERALARRAATRSAGGTPDRIAATREARTSAQATIARGGALYRALRLVTTGMKIDLLLFGRIRSGPFFALLRKVRPLGQRPVG